MKIKFLYFAGCSTYRQALSRLRGVMEETGVSADIVTREVTSDSLATELNFHGSPTILVNGRDIDPIGSGEQPQSLNCRMYTDEEGRLTSLPPMNILRSALAGRGNM